MTAPTADRARESYALVQRAQAGDNEAFAEIYRQYRDKIFHFACCRTSGDTALSDDITQDVFVRLIKNVKGITWRGEDLGAWLTTVARNRIADHYRSGRYRLEFLDDERATEDRPDDDPLVNPTAWINTQHAIAELTEALSVLTDEQHETVTLQYLHETSVADVAHRLGRTEGAVKAITYRGRNAMRLVIEQRRGSE